MLDGDVNFLGRQGKLGKQVFVRVQHTLAQMRLLLQCSACSEDTGALCGGSVVVCLTDDLMS